MRIFKWFRKKKTGTVGNCKLSSGVGYKIIRAGD